MAAGWALGAAVTRGRASFRAAGWLAPDVTAAPTGQDDVAADPTEAMDLFGTVATPAALEAAALAQEAATSTY